QQLLHPRQLGLPGDAIRLASRLLAALPTRHGLGAGAVFLDAVGLRLRQRLLGLPPGGARAAVRPGLFHAAALADAGLVLPAQLHGRLRPAAELPVRGAALGSLLLRRLLRQRLPAPWLQPVVRSRGALPRPAVRLLPLAEPRQPRLAGGPAPGLPR